MTPKKKNIIPQMTTEDQIAAVGEPENYESVPASDPVPEPD